MKSLYIKRPSVRLSDARGAEEPWGAKREGFRGVGSRPLKEGGSADGCRVRRHTRGGLPPVRLPAKRPPMRIPFAGCGRKRRVPPSLGCAASRGAG
ncbi:hypothetical protein GCM10027091_79540 [Streptomyces daliensis]